PGLDGLAAVLRGETLHLAVDRLDDVRAFLERSCHGVFSSSPSEGELAVAPAAAAADDELVRCLLLVARRPALGEHAGRAHGRAARLRLAFAAAQRVVVVVADDGAGDRTLAAVARAAGLAPADVLVVRVADLADGGAALDGDLADFAGGQHEGRHPAFTV